MQVPCANDECGKWFEQTNPSDPFCCEQCKKSMQMRLAHLVVTRNTKVHNPRKEREPELKQAPQKKAKESKGNNTHYRPYYKFDFAKVRTLLRQRYQMQYIQEQMNLGKDALLAKIKSDAATYREYLKYRKSTLRRSRHPEE